LSPLLDVSVIPKSAVEAAKLQCALGQLAAGDPTLSFREDAATGQTIIHGTSEAQLDAHIESLRHAYDVEADFGRVQISYLETIGHRTETKYTYKKQAGGSGHYAEVKIAFEPTNRNTGIIFENKVVAGAVPLKYIPIIEKAVRLQAESGVLAGFPTVDFKFTLIDGKYHDVDSSALAFEIAAKACFRELSKTGLVRLLEPIMRVEVSTPSEYAKEIIGDLRKRSDTSALVEPRGETEVVSALVPLAAMLGYAAVLSDLSDGRAQVSMQYQRHHEVVLPDPPDGRFPPAVAMRA
jgi:elongation factor G